MKKIVEGASHVIINYRGGAVFCATFRGSALAEVLQYTADTAAGLSPGDSIRVVRGGDMVYFRKIQEGENQ